MTTIHMFNTTTDAYDATQGDEDVKTGDILLLLSERVVGIADVWPFALTTNRGALHAIGEGFSCTTANGLPIAAYAEATALIQSLGFHND